MDDNIQFGSILGPIMNLHMERCKVSLAKSSYSIRLHHLHDFDDYLNSVSFQEGRPIDEHLVTGWLSSHNYLASSTIMVYTNSIRQFLHFYSQVTGIYAYEPPLHQVDDSYAPYIFSDKEMDNIYHLVDNYHCKAHNTLPYISLEFPMIIRLLDSNGFRLNELITTKMTEVDCETGIIKMVNSKNDKQRLVPLEESMARLLKDYCKAMDLEENSSAYLFPRSTSKMESKVINATFTRSVSPLLKTPLYLTGHPAVAVARTFSGRCITLSFRLSWTHERRRDGNVYEVFCRCFPGRN